MSPNLSDLVGKVIYRCSSIDVKTGEFTIDSNRIIAAVSIRQLDAYGELTDPIDTVVAIRTDMTFPIRKTQVRSAEASIKFEGTSIFISKKEIESDWDLSEKDAIRKYAKNALISSYPIFSHTQN